MSLCGRSVQKHFDGHGTFQGTVVSLDRSAKPALYKVCFEDGDEEEFTRAEVLAHLKQEVKTKGRMSHVGIAKDERSKKEANASKGAGAGVPAEFEIERLLGSRVAAGGAEYLVHWKVATGRGVIHALPCTVH